MTDENKLDDEVVRKLRRLSMIPEQAPGAEFDPAKLTPQERAKAIEAILNAHPRGELPVEETLPKTREILFRGVVYAFKPIGPQSEQGRRPGVIERWQSDIHLDDGHGFNIVVDELYGGRFTPWSYEGVFFTDFIQAAIVGVVSGASQAHWHREQWQHERTRRNFMFFVLPAVALIALTVGIIIGLRNG